MKKISFSFLLILFIATACSTSHNTQLSQLLNKNDQFLQYSDPTYGIQIDYPTTWTKFPLMQDNGRDIVIFVPPTAGKSDISDSIDLGYQNNPQNQTLSEHLAKYRATLDSLQVKGNWNSYNRGEVKGFEGIFSNPNSATVLYFTRPESNNPVFTLSFGGQALKFVDQVAASVHFTKLTVQNNNKINIPIPDLETQKIQQRDALRSAGAHQIATALELYKYEHGQYPDAQNGVPKNLTPHYIYYLPQSPKPADGSCSDHDNLFWYAPTQRNLSYTLSFCLGLTEGSFSEGKHFFTPDGLK